MRRSSSFAPALLSAALWAVAPILAGAPPTGGLTGAAELARVYDAVFDARFDDVPALAAGACPPAPAEACQLLDALVTWWRIQLDPDDTNRDDDFRVRAEAAVSGAAAWTTREGERAEAWFYLASAIGARAQWRALRGQRLAAAGDGARIKDALERALALDPGLAEAQFGRGLYRYYADVVPTAFKILRWILFLPGGDRKGGLQEMLRARRAGLLASGEADYQLHLVYLWYEKDPDRALSLVSDLGARYPHNLRFRQLVAEIQDFYVDDTQASLRTWEDLLETAQRRRVAEPEMAEASARLGIASQLDQLSRGDAALDHLHTVIAARPSAPYAVVARAHLQLGATLDRLGRRSEAAAAYRAAIAEAPSDDRLRIAARARAALRAQRR
jgi:tetratricopeptide (TPR) repeat protein